MTSGHGHAFVTSLARHEEDENVNVTLQYFDGCPNWRETEVMLERLVAEGFEVSLQRQRIETPEEAERHNFRGSPTVVIAGIDPFADPGAPTGLACRVYRTEEGYSGSPSLDQLRAAIQAASAS